MDDLAIKEFISLYQYSLFSQVRAIYGSLVPEENDFGEFLIKYREGKIEKSDYRGKFVGLLENSNLVDVADVLPNFHFVKPLYLDDRFAFFGRDSSIRLDIGLDLSSRKVIMFDNMNNTYAYIADSEIGFLNYLRINLEFTLLSSEIINREGASMMFRQKAISAVGGEDYGDYYRFIFPVKGYPETSPIKFPFKI